MASRVLRDVTNYKRSQLTDRRAAFEVRKHQLLEQVEKSDDPIATLIDGVEKLGLKLTTTSTQFGGFSLDNARLMHKQSQFDASIPSTLIDKWRADLQRLLDVQSNRFEYADLFSQLATEWVDKPNEANIILNSPLEASDDDAARSTSSDSDSFDTVQVGREEMHRQRQEWDSFVFTERPTDTAAIQKYLTELYVQPQQKKKVRETPFDHLRNWKDELGNLSCDSDDVVMCIKSVLKADLLSGRKRDELVSLRDAGGKVLNEIADVINMEIANLHGWEWKPSPIPAQMRKQINGKYRVYMSPEIHQALLVQWIGAQLAVTIKRKFTSFFRSNAWPKSSHNSMTARDHVRAAFYLGENRSDFSNSLLYARREQFKDDFFLTQLPSSLSEGNRDYNNPGTDDDEDQVDGKSPLEVKQTLLRLATTEMMVQKKIYGSFTLCQTDFKWFGPSLPHNTIYAVMEFLGLGVHGHWMDFFKKYLTMDLVFPQDGPNAEARTRRCGVPISQTLSDAFGETILACLDFAVSKATKGRCQLYRFHDDVWFWGQKGDCEIAWQTIQNFNKVMGLSLNEEKTGSIHISDNGEKPSTILPKGSVRWGFLVMDPAKARWVVDMTNVEEHIEEMRRQFAQARSVLSWIQAYNSYVGRFLGNNFGHPARCLGAEHLDMVFSTFKYIQNKLFASPGGDASTAAGDVTSYLKATIEERFGTKNIANAFLYWPIEFGGLELRNPFIPLMNVRKDSKKTPDHFLEVAWEEDEEKYDEAKEKFLNDKSKHRIDAPKGCDPETFMPFDEFVRFREETSKSLTSAYMKLLESPKVSGFEKTHFVDSAIRAIPLEFRGSKSIKADFGKIDDYWRSIIFLYAGEAMKRFGGLGLGEKEMLPIELVKLMKSERVRWQG